MAQFYSDPERENDPHALPDVEVFHMNLEEIKFEIAGDDTCWHEMWQRTLSGDPEKMVGWYWWNCLLGCLPDSNPDGPFDTENEAISDMRLANHVVRNI